MNRKVCNCFSPDPLAECMVSRGPLALDGSLRMFGKKNEIGDVSAAELHRMLKVCPSCQGSLHAHHYADFAITVASDETRTRLPEFFQALKEHRWSEAKRFQDFDPRYNAAVAKVLRCVTGSLVMLITRDPEELLESINIEAVEVLSQKSGRELEAEIEPNQWRTLS